MISRFSAHFPALETAQITALSDAKTSAEANALKTLALDHIGAIAAHLCHDLSRVSALPSIKTVREVSPE